jgi:hypothetical protein
LRLVNWAALGALAVGLFLVLQSASASRRPGPSSGSLLGLAAGAVVIAIVIGRDLDQLGKLPEAFLARPVSIVVAIAAIAVAFALVDVAYVRALPLLARLLGSTGVPSDLRADAAVAVLSLAIAVVTLVGLVRLDRASVSTGGVRDGVPSAGATPGEMAPSDAPSLASPSATPGPGTGSFAAVRAFDLPAEAMAVTMRTGRDGYVALNSGQILAFSLPADSASPIKLKTVLDGLDHPRGIAIRGDRLYVVERGPLPCAPDQGLCGAWDVNPESGVDGEVTILSTGRARVRAFDIGADGTIGPGVVVLAGLPVVDALHTANDLTIGPDGLLYLPVGNVDKLFRAPERVDGTTPHPEWLGTVLRFDGAGDPPEVYAEGLRNVYQVAFDDLGRMWGIDNDGPAIDGWRAEEILQIKQGGNYGFPFEGTFGPKKLRNDFALWTSRHKGSAGLAWADRVGLGPGLLVGSAGALSLLLPGDREDLWTGGFSEYVEQDLLDVPGFVTSIEVVSANEVVASVYGGGTGSLYLIQIH